MFCSTAIDQLVCKVVFYGQNVQCESFTTYGLPYVSVARGASCKIGKGFNMNNNMASNPIGITQPCILFVDKDAQLTIGDNVGISQTALVCHISITIGNNVKIGGGVSIYDTDFHPLDANSRIDPKLDKKNQVKRPVLIHDNAFIGAHTTILKGVTIGKNSIIGACSVVTKDVPEDQIWAGNPARMLKTIIKE